MLGLKREKKDNFIFLLTLKPIIKIKKTTNNNILLAIEAEKNERPHQKEFIRQKIEKIKSKNIKKKIKDPRIKIETKNKKIINLKNNSEYHYQKNLKL